MSNYLPSEIIERMNDLFLSGYGIRSVARELKIAKSTAQRYFPRIGGEPTCPCGKIVRHQGWCSFRYSLSPSRQEFMARWQAGRPPAIIRIKLPPRVSLEYPFLPQGKPSNNGSNLLLLVNGLVPRGLPEQLRGDVCQEIILAVLAGELKETDIPSEIRRFVGSTRKNQEAHYMAISLDAPREDGRSWHDILHATIS